MKQGKRWGKMITAQKMKFFVKDFFSKCNQIAENCEFSHLLKKSLMENIIFCALNYGYVKNIWTNIYLILQTEHFSHYLLACHQSKHEDIMQARIKCIKVSFKKSTEFRMPLR